MVGSQRGAQSPREGPSSVTTERAPGHQLSGPSTVTPRPTAPLGGAHFPGTTFRKLCASPFSTLLLRSSEECCHELFLSGHQEAPLLWRLPVSLFLGWKKQKCHRARDGSMKAEGADAGQTGTRGVPISPRTCQTRALREASQPELGGIEPAQCRVHMRPALG